MAEQRADRNTRGRLISVLIIASVVIVLAGVGWVLVRRGRAERVAVLGDSITVLSEGHLQDISSHYRLQVGAVNGATAEAMTPAARLLAAHHPEQVILNLGTNNVLQNKESPKAALAAIDSIIRLFSGARCIHLVTVNEQIVSFSDPTLTGRIRQLDAGIRRLAAQRKGVDLIDWSADVKRYYDAKEPQGGLTSDTVHPTDVGQQILAGYYAKALKSCHRSLT